MTSPGRRRRTLVLPRVPVDRPGTSARTVPGWIDAEPRPRLCGLLTWKGHLARQARVAPSRTGRNPAVDAARRVEVRFHRERLQPLREPHLPPQRRIVPTVRVRGCLEPVPLADTPPGSRPTRSDHLALLAGSPVIGVVLDFGGEGRIRLRADRRDTGRRLVSMDVEMTAPDLGELRDSEYFWKARPVVVAAGEPRRGDPA
ncbi:hypothetical protein HBB16_08375 [Pseudonocardia sp. MCCB 268]|nr:hypothetical protein [Pseudonocardia cytotoxica]